MWCNISIFFPLSNVTILINSFCLEKKRFAVKHTYHSDRKHHYLCLFESTSPLIVSYIGLQPNVAKWSDTSTVIWIHAEIFTVEIYRI